MSFKEVLDLNCEVTTALGGVDKKTGKANPTQVEGYLIGSRDVESKKSRTGFAKLYVIQTEKGNLGVWGKTDLDRKMTSVKAGTMVRITQNGKVSTPNGDMYKFKVEVDEYNVIDVGPQPVQQAAHAEESNISDDDLSDTNLDLSDEVPYTAPAKPARAASTPDAARQAKVQALLAGNRTKN